jgi:hypothetical protein
VAVPVFLELVPADSAIPLAAPAVAVIIPFLSIPNETLLLFENVTVPVDLELVPPDIAKAGAATDTTLNVTNPFVSIPQETFCPVLANEIVPVDLELVPADMARAGTTTLPVITPLVAIPKLTPLEFENVIVPELLVFAPAEIVSGNADIAVLKVILPFVSIPIETPLEVELNTIVPTDLEFVPAEIHKGACAATETTLNVTNPLVSIPTDTF